VFRPAGRNTKRYSVYSRQVKNVCQMRIAYVDTIQTKMIKLSLTGLILPGIIRNGRSETSP
ncbi:MAG: hypothetical protein BZY67_02305, partial [SAR202 cluster bacterium Io17-Chloro-G1]